MAPAPEVPSSVLFACTMNAVRSPMAAAIFAHLAGPSRRVRSAGVKAGLPDPYMVAVMDEIGIDTSDHEPQQLRVLGDETFELIVTLSPEAHHHAVEMTRTMAADAEYWPTLDATAGSSGLSRDAKLARYRQVRDHLMQRMSERFGFKVDIPE